MLNLVYVQQFIKIMITIHHTYLEKQSPKEANHLLQVQISF